MAVNAPGREHTLREAILAGAAHVVHHLVRLAAGEGRPDAPGEVVQRVVPGTALPPAGASLADPSHRVEDALGIVLLGDRGRALGAVPAAAPGVQRVALVLPDLAGLLVHVGEQAAG